jgi:hypothetical protein
VGARGVRDGTSAMALQLWFDRNRQVKRAARAARAVEVRGVGRGHTCSWRDDDVENYDGIGPSRRLHESFAEPPSGPQCSECDIFGSALKLVHCYFPECLLSEFNRAPARRIDSGSRVGPILFAVPIVRKLSTRTL